MIGVPNNGEEKLDRRRRVNWGDTQVERTVEWTRQSGPLVLILTNTLQVTTPSEVRKP